MSSIKKKRILAAVLCAGTIAAFYQPAPVAAAGSGLTYLDDIYGWRAVSIADSVTINGVTMYGSGDLSASTISTSYIGATSGSIGGVSLSNNDLTNVSDISASGTISANHISTNSGTIGGVTTAYKEYYNYDGFYLRSGYETDIDGILTVDNLNAGSGTIQTTGTVSAGSLGVTYDASVGRNLSVGNSATVNGTTTLNGATDINNTLDVSGNTTVGGSLTVANHVVVGTRSVSDGEGGYVQVGQISGNSPLYVEDVLFDGANMTTAGTVSAGTLNVSGVSTLGNVRIANNTIDNATTSQPLVVEGVTMNDGTISAGSGNFTVDGLGDVTTRNLTTNGSISATGNISTDGDITADGSITAAGTLNGGTGSKIGGVTLGGTNAIASTGFAVSNSGDVTTAGTLTAETVKTNSLVLGKDGTTEIALSDGGALMAASGKFNVATDGKVTVGDTATSNITQISGSTVTIGGSPLNQTVIEAGTSHTVAQDGSLFYQADVGASGQSVSAYDSSSGLIGASTLSATQIQNSVGYNDDYKATRTITLDEINDSVVDGDYSTTHSLTSTGSTLAVTDGDNTTTVSTTAGGMSVTGSTGYGMDVDTTTGAVTFTGSASSPYIAGGATTTTINGNTITTGHITTDSITINGADGTQTLLNADGSVSLANGYFTVSKEGYLTNEFAGAHSTVSLTTDADGVHASYYNGTGSTSRDLSWGVITDKVEDGSNSTTNTTTATGNTSIITNGTASNTTTATLGGTTITVTNGTGNTTTNAISTTGTSTTVADGTDTVDVTTTTSGTTFTSSTANTAFVTGGATSTTINGNTITTGQITTDKLIINNNASDGGNVGSGSELVLSGDGSITSSIESGSNQGDFSTSATAINSSVTNGTSTGNSNVTATAVTDAVTDGTNTTTVTTSAGSHVIAADGSTTTFDSNGILASNNGTQTTINGNVVTVGTGSNSTTISGSTVTVGASGSATTITDSDVELSDGTKLSELGHVEDIAPAINPGLGGTVVDGLNNLNTRVDEVNDRLDHVGAMSAAIASLKTMGYDPQAPTEVAVGAGTYKGSTGLALGVFHYPNRDFMLNVSYTTSGGENMGGIGATWKFGRKTPEKLLEEQRKEEADKVKIAQEKAAAAAQLAQEAKERAEYAAKAAEKAKAEADIAADAAQKTYEKHVK